MEKQKILKPKDKILIISDYREKKVIEHLKNLGVIVNERSLDVGDFVASNRVAIERKAHSDFIRSIIDGSIFEQASMLKKNFEKPIILIEGYSYHEISENALKAALASLLIDFGVSILTTRNPFDTAKTIFWIAKKEQSEAGREIAIRVGKKPKEVKKIQEFIVCSIPGVSTVTAKKLLKQLGSVEKIFTANENELQKAGVSKKTAEKIRRVLTTKYN
ncbi:MAG: ERCC4 domain-containing protein [Candidatus Aenigmarchaeota archaeon]|nr:ERCC4 domain-containing protein [Candidatus Aenigmarchaeota archaeon]